MFNSNTQKAREETMFRYKKIYFVLAILFIAGLFLAVPQTTLAETRLTVKTHLKALIATVMGVDYKLGRITLKDTKGNSATLALQKNAKNLDKVKIGDKLIVELYRSEVLGLVPANGKPADLKFPPVDVAPEGNMPGVKDVKILRAKAKVLKMDSSKKTVTLKTQKGTFTLDIHPGAKIGPVKTGDEVLAFVTDAIVMSLRRPEQ